MEFITEVLGGGSTSGFADLWFIIITDIVLSADNALIIGMAAAGLSPELRKKAIVLGIAIAAGLRIIFTIGATYILDIPFVRIVGAILLAWVCWKLFLEIRGQQQEAALAAAQVAEDDNQGYQGAPKKTLFAALLSIAIADFSMSLDNVLAVAQIAGHNTAQLIFGLILAIILMAFFATIILKILTRFPIISWIGLIVLVYVTLEMFYHGYKDAVVWLAKGSGVAG